MKEIERYSQALASLPSREITLFDSAKAVFKSSFGNRWPNHVLLLLVLVFLPLFFYWKRVQLEPALFVTEWIKLATEGIIFFFILEIVRHRSMSFEAQKELRSLVTANYILPIQAVIDSLTQFRAALESHTTRDLLASIAGATHNWGFVEHFLSDDAISRLHLRGETAVPLQKQRDEMGPKRCRAILESLSTVGAPEDLDSAEFEELMGRLQTFLAALKRLYEGT